MLITPDQIRAARALKNWSQTELAERTGLAVPTIANIEAGKQSPGKNTMEKIIHAFTIGGVKFTSKGIEKTDNSIEHLEGYKNYYQLLADALKSLNKGDEILLLGCDEKRSPPDVLEHNRLLRDKGVRIRSLISEDNIFIGGKPEDNRQIPKKYFLFEDVITIYGNKVATTIPIEDTGKKRSELSQIIIVENERLANDYKRIFEFMWDHAKPLKKFKDVHQYKHPMLENYTPAQLKKMAEE